ASPSCGSPWPSPGPRSRAGAAPRPLRAAGSAREAQRRGWGRRTRRARGARRMRARAPGPRGTPPLDRASAPRSLAGGDLAKRIAGPALGMARVGAEVHLARIRQRARVLLEPLGQPAEQRPLRPAGRPRGLGDEAIRAPTLVLVVRPDREAVHVVAEDAGHEQRVVADVAAQEGLFRRIELWRAEIPCALDREEGVGHRLEPPRGRALDG